MRLLLVGEGDGDRLFALGEGKNRVPLIRVCSKRCRVDHV